MEIVFATTSAVVSHPETGASVLVTHGTHWPADDPVAVAYPSHFTDDPRFGLSSSRRLRDDGYPVGSEAAEAADEADDQGDQADDDQADQGDQGTSSSSGAVETTTADPGTRRSRGKRA